MREECRDWHSDQPRIWERGGMLLQGHRCSPTDQRNAAQHVVWSAPRPGSVFTRIRGDLTGLICVGWLSDGVFWGEGSWLDLSASDAAAADRVCTMDFAEEAYRWWWMPVDVWLTFNWFSSDLFWPVVSEVSINQTTTRPSTQSCRQSINPPTPRFT